MPATTPNFRSADTAREVLESFRTWAVVGCRPDPSRPSYFVAEYLQRRGYRIIPVNAEHDGETILGERCYADLGSIPRSEGVEVVDLFRRAHLVPDHVDEAVAIGAKAVWMQVGIVNEEAARRAADAGLLVVMDRCPKVDWPTLVGNRVGAGFGRP